MEDNSTDPGRSVASKVVAILLAFTMTRTYTITELAHHTGLPLSTAHRLVGELIDARVLEREQQGRLRAGFMLRMVAGNDSKATDIGQVAAPMLDDLSKLVGNRVRLGILAAGRANGRRYLAVDYMVSAPGCATSQFGSGLAPIHATAMGKVLLAYGRPRELSRAISQGLAPYTRHTMTDPTGFRKVITQSRAQRYAIADQELHLGDRALAVPVFGVGQNATASLEIRVHELATGIAAPMAILKVAARSLSRQFIDSSNQRLRKRRSTDELDLVHT